MQIDNQVWFFDESRFGTHSNIGHGWFKKGSRTPVQIKLGYENFYVYSAINAKHGEIFSLLLPKVNTQYMNIFLEAFKKHLGFREIYLVMDGATWHRSKALQQYDNINIVIQPPYSPELNPVERLWQHIKRNVLRNRIYETLGDLENEVCKFLSSIQAKTIRSLCSYNMVI